MDKTEEGTVVAPVCKSGCGARDADAKVKLIEVQPAVLGDQDDARVGTFRCEGCGDVLLAVLGADDVLPAWVPFRPAGWTEDNRVHLRVGQDEAEVVGQREVPAGSGTVIDLRAPRWLGIVRDVVATLKEGTPEGAESYAGFPAFLGQWWARPTFCEEYADFRVLHRKGRGDESVSIISKTPEGALALHEAADRRRMYYAGMERFGVAPENR